MEVGLFFGSFNPIHTGHMIIANYMANHTHLDQVWLVVSPHNPLKKSSDLIQFYDRLEMAKLAAEDSQNIRVSDIEFNLPRPSYTIDTLIYLKEKYPDNNFTLIMGSDNLASLKKWKNFEIILRDYQIAVYPRPGFLDEELSKHTSVLLTSTPLMEISSTFIRKAIEEKRNVKYFVPDSVLQFIESKSLYSK